MSVGLVAGLIVSSLLVGAFATSFAEYSFQYNLYDYVVEGVKKALGFASKVEADAKALGASGKAAVEGAVKDAKEDLKADVVAVEKKL
jgi:4-aminobutyrate aminotransferase-like enzyme